MNIVLPSALKDLPENKRVTIIEEIRKALNVAPPITPASVNPKENKEHSMWTRNDESLLAEAEEELYETLVMSAMNNMASLIAALGLTNEHIDIYKSLTEDYIEYEEELIKGKDKRSKLSDLWELAKTKRQSFLKYLQEGSNWTKKKLKQIDDILKRELPDYAKVAEEYSVRAAFIAKIRAKADTEALNTLGAYVDRFPSTIVAARHENVVLTARESRIPVERENTSVVVTEAELDEARRLRQQQVTSTDNTPVAPVGQALHSYKILPLQPQEVRTVENAEIRTADKLTEVSDRHRAGIKQIVLQAINGRWSAQQLAQALYDEFADQNRDWRRVAITELAMASNDAFLAGCTEGDTVWVPPVEGACKYCIKYLEGKTFIVTQDPKLMGNDYQQEMSYTWVGKTNYGRNVAAWIPCIPLHPNCRHRYHKISRFYKVDQTGKPVLKTTVELIQEERARRGMAPDPNLK